MTFSRYLITTFLAAIFSWTAWVLVLFKLDPFESTLLALFFFFISFFFASTSTLTLLGFYLRKFIYQNEVFTSHLNVALRQGLLLTLCILGCLIFLMLGVLTWWDGLLLVGIIVLVEFYFSSSE